MEIHGHVCSLRPVKGQFTPHKRQQTSWLLDLEFYKNNCHVYTAPTDNKFQPTQIEVTNVLVGVCLCGVDWP